MKLLLQLFQPKSVLEWWYRNVPPLPIDQTNNTTGFCFQCCYYCSPESFALWNSLWETKYLKAFSYSISDITIHFLQHTFLLVYIFLHACYKFRLLAYIGFWGNISDTYQIMYKQTAVNAANKQTTEYINTEYWRSWHEVSS